MARPIVPLLVTLGLLLTAGAASAVADDDASAPIREALQSYVEAFNSHDAAAVAEHWSEEGVYLDRESGEKIEGREALAADFAQLFEANPDVTLVGELIDISFVTDDVATVTGTASVYSPDASAAHADFSATFVLKGDRWMLHSVHESDAAAPETAYDALQALE